MKIAVYDSGLGGLWVLNSLIKKYPNHQYLYLGDQINAPYGNKDKNELLEIVKNNFEWLKSQGVQHIVVACNTVCSIGGLDIAIDNVKIDGIIEKTAKQLDSAKFQQILVLATPLTIANNKYQEILKSENNQVLGLALPKLVALLENDAGDPEIHRYLNEEFSQLNQKPDAIILGCTHYPFVKDYIKSYFKADVFDSNDLDFDFGEESLQPSVEIYTSGDAPKFKKAINNLFKHDYEVKSK